MKIEHRGHKIMSVWTFNCNSSFCSLEQSQVECRGNPNLLWFPFISFCNWSRKTRQGPRSTEEFNVIFIYFSRTNLITTKKSLILTEHTFQGSYSWVCTIFYSASKNIRNNFFDIIFFFTFLPCSLLPNPFLTITRL